jgi:hypothetical protein
MTYLVKSENDVFECETFKEIKDLFDELDLAYGSNDVKIEISYKIINLDEVALTHESA